MKDTIQELASTKDTTTATDTISNLQGKSWLKKIIEAAKRRMVFAQFAYETDLPKGTKDLAVPIYSSNITDWVAQSGATGEGVERTMTPVDNLTTVTFTPTTYRYGCAISKDVVRTSQVDVVKHAREQLTYYAAYSVESGIVSALDGASNPNEVHCGGGNTADSGDVLDPDAIAEGARKLKANSWFPEPNRPFVLIIPAVAEEALMKDSQFVNASEYGSNEIVLNGEIGKYLGIRVMVSEFCTSKTDSDSEFTTDGHHCYLFKSQVAYGIAWGEKPTLDYEFNKLESEHRVYLDLCYKADTLQESSLCLIYAADK
ncbi:MAG: N4-gp56 family major capsid protein [Elusimicrobiota bacterium]